MYTGAALICRKSKIEKWGKSGSGKHGPRYRVPRRLLVGSAPPDPPGGPSARVETCDRKSEWDCFGKPARHPSARPFHLRVTETVQKTRYFSLFLRTSEKMQGRFAAMAPE